MKKHGFNGTFGYEPEYSCDAEDYETAKELFEGMEVDVSHVSPVVDAQLGEDRAVLLSVTRREPMKELERSQCFLFIDEFGNKYFYVPDVPLPESTEEFASSMKDWTAGGDSVRKRSNFWQLAHQLSNNGQEMADSFVHGQSDLVEVLEIEETEGGELEIEISYDSRLESIVKKHYGTDEVDDEMISSFIVDALKQEVKKTNE